MLGFGVNTQSSTMHPGKKEAVRVLVDRAKEDSSLWGTKIQGLSNEYRTYLLKGFKRLNPKPRILTLNPKP